MQIRKHHILYNRVLGKRGIQIQIISPFLLIRRDEFAMDRTKRVDYGFGIFCLKLIYYSLLFRAWWMVCLHIYI